MGTCKGVGSIYRGKLYLFIHYLLFSYSQAEASIQANYSSFYNKLKFYSIQSNHCCTSSVIISSCLLMSPLVSSCLTSSPLISSCLLTSPLVSSCLTSSPLVSSCLTSSPLVSSCAVLSIMPITSCNVICNSGWSFCCASVNEL